MKICVIIPSYNEEMYVDDVLNSFLSQTRIPDKIIFVDDNSTDDTFNIANELSKKHECLSVIKNISTGLHNPGKKIVQAFYRGINSIDNEDYDLIGKFDSDIILPINYFEKLIDLFSKNKNLGISGGNLFILQNYNWVYENISEKTKVRGPIKLYRKECFNEIGGLKESIGWDTIDELLAQYHGWEILTDPTLKVKHLKPTGKAYTKDAKLKQGEAFYKMRYGFILTLIATIKLSFKKGSFSFFVQTMRGYFSAMSNRIDFIVSVDEGKFIRKYRWKNIRKKLF
jgi:cellulose synthase/poly-beta-1,6-N-acetylglucosamine synthase-like glycosyltransferase